tara:strand:- start:1639 stop:1890 length:252 start_codon:yes stop_codon:yes gene_type:complete
MNKEHLELKVKWGKKVRDNLKGKTIVDARYLKGVEQQDLGWDSSSIVLFLDDGQHLLVSMDDEGNGPGSLFTSYEDLPIIPVV